MPRRGKCRSVSDSCITRGHSALKTGAIIPISLFLGICLTNSAVAANKVALMLNYYVNGQHAPFYYGLEKGYFAKHGIDLTIEQGRNSSVTVSTTAAGTVQFGYADIPTMIGAAVRGAPVIAVGGVIRTNPSAVLSFAGHPVRTPAEMKGKTLAVDTGGANVAVFPLFLKNVGLKMSDFTVIAGSPLVKLDALISGRANMMLGFVTTQPMQIKAATGQNTVVIRFADHGVNLLNAAIIVRKSYANDHAALVRRFLAALDESMKATQENPQAAAAAITKLVPKSGKPAAMLAGLEAAIPLWQSVGKKKLPFLVISRAEMAQTLHLMAEAHLAPASAEKDPTGYYTDAYLPK